MGEGHGTTLDIFVNILFILLAFKFVLIKCEKTGKSRVRAKVRFLILKPGHEVLTGPLPFHVLFPEAPAAESLALVRSGNRCEGLLQVQSLGQQGLVCGDHWGLREASVICRQLGCGHALYAPTYVVWPQEAQKSLLRGVQCRGVEASLWECSRGEWGSLHGCECECISAVHCSGRARAPGVASARLWPRPHPRPSLLGGAVLPEFPRVEDKTLLPGVPVTPVLWLSDPPGAEESWRPALGSRVLAEPVHAPPAGSAAVERARLVARAAESRSIGPGRAERALARGNGRPAPRVPHTTWQWPRSSKSRARGRAGPNSGPRESSRSSVCSTWTPSRVSPAGGSVLRVTLSLHAPRSAPSTSRRPVYVPSVSRLRIRPGARARFRLANGSSSCEGRVELQVQGPGAPLCQHWDNAERHVLCRPAQLCNAVARTRGGHFGAEDRCIWLTASSCGGTDPYLLELPSKAPPGAPTVSPRPGGWREDRAAVNGRVEDLLDGVWAASLDDVGTCVGAEGECAGKAGYRGDHRRDAGVVCSGEPGVRLAAGPGRCAGRVELLRGRVGTVCDDAWDLRDAHVVCRQLGCGRALSAPGAARFGAGAGRIWLDELRCQGHESALWQCPSAGWGRHDCGHKEDAGVFCSEFTDLRLHSRGQPCAGRLEVFYNGTWGGVCPTLSAASLRVLCAQLGCGPHGQLRAAAGSGSATEFLWVASVRCRDRHDQSLWQCPSAPWDQHSCASGEEAWVLCTEKAGEVPQDPGETLNCSSPLGCPEEGAVRLRGGRDGCSGRVELWHAGSWGTVCDDAWDLADAEVVCRQLGCGPAVAALGAAAFGPGSGPVWLDEVGCRGSEGSLRGCAAERWGRGDCAHKEDAGVRCSEPGPGSPPPGAPLWTLRAVGVILGALLGPLLLGLLAFLILPRVAQVTQRGLGRSEVSPGEAIYDVIGEMPLAGLYEEIVEAEATPQDEEDEGVVNVDAEATGQGEEDGGVVNVDAEATGQGEEDGGVVKTDAEATGGFVPQLRGELCGGLRMLTTRRNERGL
nr:scavenger receptor cysteine-rich domain-containing protein SCART1-like [Aotus nancymaae]